MPLALSRPDQGSGTLTDRPARTRAGLDVERATRRFYDQFRIERQALLDSIGGIDDATDRAWYASLTLNRLMVVYFLQHRGFLDGRRDYLQDRLARCQGSFYRDFLLPLFQDGLGGTARNPDLDRLLGRVPRLNGGLFDRHAVERRCPAIAIPDEAFARLFTRFDRYRWQLDERPLREADAINPDVLGHILEKYVNQKQMGAYYTREDITEYIAKNTIIPFLLDEALRTPAGLDAWHYLRDDPDRYICAGAGHDRAGRHRARLAAGEVRRTDDLVTLNLDIRRFAQDVIERCATPDLLGTLWKALTRVTILDPTCGSGAFLFAALDILEPLYAACLDRMAAFDEVTEPAAIRTAMLGHRNRRFFILKTIVVNNLFGVDIMEEAVEICRLRLFLKLAAQVDPDPRHDNLGMEPLPDIGANIRAGNALVGYASPPDPGDAGERQTADRLDRHLAAACGIGTGDSDAYARWRRDQAPFHWCTEFRPIMQGGGFDVVIGNPPYAAIPETLDRALLRRSFESALERWSRDEDLCTLVVERALALLRQGCGRFGMILPLSASFSTKRPYVALRRELTTGGSWAAWSHFDRIPSALFGSEVRTRCSILLLSRNGAAAGRHCVTTALNRWNADSRDSLFATLQYSGFRNDASSQIPKLGSDIQARTLDNLRRRNPPLATDLGEPIAFSALAAAAPHFPQPAVYVGGTAYNWFPAWRDVPPTTDRHGRPSLPARTAGYGFQSDDAANIVFALLCSSLGYWWWSVASDGFNLKKWLLESFPISSSGFRDHQKRELAKLGADLRSELKKHYVYKDNRGRIGNYFLPACAPQVLAIDDAIDRARIGLEVGFLADIREHNASFARLACADDPAEN